MSSQHVFETLQKAGTVLCNSTGHIFFDLNGKSPADCQSLKDVLHGVALRTGSQIHGNVPHPLTQSQGTLQLVLNVDPANPQADTARHFRDLLFQTGNAFYYETGALREAHGRVALQDDAEKIKFMSSCHKMVPQHDAEESWKPGHSLSEYAVMAIALNAHTNPLKAETYVPVNLYAGDSIKAVAIETALRGVAKHVGGTYSQQASVVKDGSMHDFHLVQGDQVAEYFISKKENAATLIDHVFISEVQADVVRFSPGPTNLAPLPKNETMGDILKDIGIQSVDIATMDIPLAFTPK